MAHPRPSLDQYGQEPLVPGAHEQDRAAGGRDARRIELGDGRHVLAWIMLRPTAVPRPGIAVSLGWRGPAGRVDERFLGHLEHTSTETDLCAGWRLARAWP